MRRFILLIAALGLVLSACAGGGSAVIATVNGTDITLDQVRALRLGDADTVEPSQFASDLQLQIVNLVVRDGAAALGLTVSTEEADEELNTIIAQIETPNPQTGESITFEEFKEQQGLSDDIIPLAIEQQVLNRKLVEYFSETVEVSDEDIETQYNIEQQSRSEVCASHILLEDEETANEVLELALAEGADFAALAQEYSTGPTGPTGGVLGCSSPATYVPEFAIATLQAPIGEPHGPVKSEFGYHIILVTDRTVPVLEEIRDELAATIKRTQANTLVTDWFKNAMNTATVTIDATYGTWAESDAGVFGVEPPSADA